MKKVIKPEDKNINLKKIVPDTSAIISGRLTKLIKNKKIENAELIIPQMVMDELRAQTSRGRETGFIGLEELRKIKSLSSKHNIKINFYGGRASSEDIHLAKTGRIDALIQDVAKKTGAVLLTTDLPQALVAEAQGIKVKYFKSYEKARKIKLEKFFTKDTMSVHLKDGTLPYAKRGKPGSIHIVKISKTPIKAEDLETMQKEIFDAVRHEDDGFIEMGYHGASVIQLKNMRIAITRPPFSDGMELTAVRPIVKLSLDDYKLSSKLKERLENSAEGILIAGPPGSGKSTFAASLAEFYFNKDKTVKTMESPRDLQVPKEITQYAPLEGSFTKTADILLLVRPDYTIFDEIRKSGEFRIFADLRLGGVGMIGTVHASKAIDAIQRFIPRIDLGVMPHVIDTLIFIKDGKIETVYSLSLTVRVPKGMTDNDLARPMVEVRNFENNKLEYEIYTYGDQTVVIPIKDERISSMHKLASEKILEEIKRFDPEAKISTISETKVIVNVHNNKIARLIGKEGKTITEVEKRLGIKIDVEPFTKTLGKEINSRISETGGYIIISFKKKYSGKTANIHVEDDYLFTATIGRKGEIKITKSSDLGKELLRAATNKRGIKVFI